MRLWLDMTSSPTIGREDGLPVCRVGSRQGQRHDVTMVSMCGVGEISGGLDLGSEAK